jgi:hypothetical protein
VDDVVVEDEVDAPAPRYSPRSFQTSLWKSSLALVGASTHVTLLVVAFSAPATKRFLFWPGVST